MARPIVLICGRTVIFRNAATALACPRHARSAIFRRGLLPEPPRLTKLGRGAQENDSVTAARIAVPLALAVAFALAARAAAPRAFEAQFLLAAQDDPVALSDHAVAHSFDAAVAAREIDAALADDDPDLAMSFLALARERNLPIDPALADRVERAMRAWPPPRARLGTSPAVSLSVRL